MALTAFNSPCSGLWPLGAYTIAAAGTTVPLNFNVGPQTEQAPPSGKPSGNVRQLSIIVPSGSGIVYLLRKVAGVTVSATGTPNFIVGAGYPGTSTPVPHSQTLGAQINIDDYVLDGSTAATCNVVAVYG